MPDFFKKHQPFGFIGSASEGFPVGLSEKLTVFGGAFFAMIESITRLYTPYFLRKPAIWLYRKHQSRVFPVVPFGSVGAAYTFRRSVFWSSNQNAIIS